MFRTSKKKSQIKQTKGTGGATERVRAEERLRKKQKGAGQNEDAVKLKKEIRKENKKSVCA